MRWVICDIDGTIADIKHRLHWIKDGEKPDWENFHRDVMGDPPKQNIISLLSALHNQGWMVCLMTGRMETHQALTYSWLARHCVSYDLVLFRRSGDFRSDTIVKSELYKRYLAHHKVELVLEDRDRVVEMWRGLGLTCLQVQKGEY